MSLSTTLARVLPPETWRGLRRRAAIVFGVALAISVVLWSTGQHGNTLDVSTVYAMAISLISWFCADPLRIALHRWLGASGPHYWVANGRMRAFMLGGIMVGYGLGTLVGDAYSGRSTWQLWALAPQRFLGFFIGSMAISAGFLFYFSQREKTIELQRQASEARLLLLESQLEPHMLFNTLANLRALITTDPARAVAMLDRLNDFLRATLRATRDNGQGHTLANEFARLTDYLELMAVRMGPRLRFALELPAALAAVPVPALLLQPLVENAIRHGLEPQLDGGSLRVSARLDGAELCLRVQDSGAGIDAAVANAAPGFGLAQVRERVAGAGGRIDIGGTDNGSASASASGASFTLYLPLPRGFAP